MSNTMKILNECIQEIKQSAHELVVSTDAMATETKLPPEIQAQYREAYMKFYEGLQIVRSITTLVEEE